jgi:hypothetical protein
MTRRTKRALMMMRTRRCSDGCPIMVTLSLQISSPITRQDMGYDFHIGGISGV